ncbi:GGDEF domain-containing protein [Planosporangium thailandense]|uniref:GGDEF domain-containing protein n=1 Tax=Planosporangium thailandense TaxID=765197 RepID=A0ABX0XYN2_9ACTN|nr:GGDEF domain-containing protein [Planosporangium thailandense]NJC70313.1 GGDEF domain-containing protein [Planosporangium thailandense]
MRGQVWKLYLAAVTAALLAFLAFPVSGWAQVGWQVVVGYAAVAALLAGPRRDGPAGRLVWWCFALGVFANTTGILVEQVDAVLHGENFPSVADGFYLALYPAVAVGLAILIRRRSGHRDRGVLVDATTVTTGFGLLAWVFMIHPAASDETLSVLGHIVSVTYPVGDVVLVAMAARLGFGRGGRNPSYWLVVASLVTFLAGDAAWAVANQLAWEPAGAAERSLSAFFLAAYTLFGAAALHPSARTVGQRVEDGPRGLSRPMLATLTLAAWIAPGVLAIQVLRRQVTDGMAIALGCVALFGLVLTRMAQLLREVEQQAAKVRELSRTDELTGLPNRRAWTAELPRAMERARRAGLPLTITMLDLDHFKQFNDSYGHPAGDRLLKESAAAWSGQMRAVDHLARYGGEEFIVLLADTDTEGALQVVERLRAVTPLGQTFSAGLATWDGRETSDEIITRADAALYAAKRGGRDRTVVADTLVGDVAVVDSAVADPA